jgi:hypothetical protein
MLSSTLNSLFDSNEHLFVNNDLTKSSTSNSTRRVHKSSCSSLCSSSSASSSCSLSSCFSNETTMNTDLLVLNSSTAIIDQEMPHQDLVTCALDDDHRAFQRQQHINSNTCEINVKNATTNAANSSSTNTFSTITSIKTHPLYKVQEKIGCGGFGEVYKGIRKIDNMPIAIKIIKKNKINSWTTNVSVLHNFFFLLTCLHFLIRLLVFSKQKVIQTSRFLYIAKKNYIFFYCYVEKLFYCINF